MAKIKNTYPKVFRPSRIARIVSFITFGMFIAVFVVYLREFLINAELNLFMNSLFNPVIGVLLLYLIFYFMWYFAERTFHFAMVITRNGIWFHGYGKRFYTWDSMILLGIVQSNSWGIKTENPQVVNRNKITKFFIRNWFPTNFIPIEAIVGLPYKGMKIRDTSKFLETELGQELYHFAPHLFDEVGKEKRKHRLHDADDVDSKFERSDNRDAEMVKRG